MDAPQGLGSLLREIAGLLVDETTLEAALEQVAKIAATALDGCDGAGVTLVAGQELVTAATPTTSSAR